MPKRRKTLTGKQKGAMKGRKSGSIGEKAVSIRLGRELRDLFMNLHRSDDYSIYRINITEEAPDIYLTDGIAEVYEVKTAMAQSEGIIDPKSPYVLSGVQYSLYGKDLPLNRRENKSHKGPLPTKYVLVPWVPRSVTGREMVIDSVRMDDARILTPRDMNDLINRNPKYGRRQKWNDRSRIRVYHKDLYRLRGRTEPTPIGMSFKDYMEELGKKIRSATGKKIGTYLDLKKTISKLARSGKIKEISNTSQTRITEYPSISNIL